MSPTPPRRRLAGLAAVVALIATALVCAAVPAAAQIEDGTRFYVPKPNHDAVQQIATLTRQGRKADAARIRAMIDTPTAVWVESDSPKKAEQQVRQVTHQAAGKNTVPVLVLYNIPFRDCAQYSAGGATSVEEYEAWIDGVVRGIGQRDAVIVLEPDSLGIIPWYTTVDGTLEWCQPAEADFVAAVKQATGSTTFVNKPFVVTAVPADATSVETWFFTSGRTCQSSLPIDDSSTASS